MRRRIKAGLKRSKKASNPDLLKFLRGVVSPKWVGFAERPIIEKITGRPYEEVKQDVLEYMVRRMLGGLTTGMRQ